MRTILHALIRIAEFTAGALFRLSVWIDTAVLYLRSRQP